MHKESIYENIIYAYFFYFSQEVDFLGAKNLKGVVVEGVHMEPQNHPMEEEMEAKEAVYLAACLILVKS